MGEPGRLVFGKYALRDRLAVGGMGEVYRGRRVESAREGAASEDVVLKTLLPELAGRPEHIEQFLAEARIAAALRHPGIVRTFEVGCDEGTYYLVMEAIDGDNLSRLVRACVARGEAVPVPVAVRIAADAARALHAAHVAVGDDGRPLGVVHRDVSPQNIMVARDGATKVVDFGIAKSTLAANMTRSGTIKGKIPYMSPEQACEELVDGKSDQYSLGVVLWEALAGRRLFTAENEVMLLRAVAAARVPGLARHRKDVGAPLAAVVARMLAKRRESRFPTLADAADALEAAGPVASLHDVSAWVRRFAPAEDPPSSSRTPSFVIDLRTSADRTAVDPDAVPEDAPDDTVVDRRPRAAEPTLARAAFYKEALLRVDALPPATRDAVRRRAPEHALRSIEDSRSAAFIPLEHGLALVAAVGGELGDDGARALFRDAVRDLFDHALFRPLTRAALAMFGGGPQALLRAVPKVYPQLFKNAGELRVEEVGSNHARVVIAGGASHFAGTGFIPATEGAFEAMYLVVDHLGTARVRLHVPALHDVLVEMSWVPIDVPTEETGDA